MAAKVEDITIAYEEEGVDLVKELDKRVLSSGAWATVIFRIQLWDKAKNNYGPERYSIRRYKKRDGEYIQQSKFTISSKEQAEKIIAALTDWIGSATETTEDSN